MIGDVYSGCSKLYGEEHRETLREASNYAASLVKSSRFAEAKSLLCKTMPVAQRVRREGDVLTLRMRKIYARAIYEDSAATLDDLGEAVNTLEETERAARRVLGGAHPIVVGIGFSLCEARAVLAVRESPPPGGT